MIDVLLVEDQTLVRTGFRMVIDSQPDLRVVGEAGDGVDGVAAAARLAPDVVVMDVRMPRLDGIEATRRVLASARPPRVLVLTTYCPETTTQHPKRLKPRPAPACLQVDGSFPLHNPASGSL